MLGLTSFLAIWACKKDTIDVQPELLTPTKNLKASERSLTDPSCCEFTNLFCTSAFKPPCKTIYTGNGGDNVFVWNGLVVKGTTYQLTPLFNDGIAADFELTTGTGTNVLTNIPKQILIDGEININQPVEKEFAILYDIADLLQQGASIEAIQTRIGNKGTIETLSNGQKQLVVNSAAFENRDVSNLTVVSNSVDCLVAKQRVAERFSDLTGIPIEICQNIVTRDPNFSCSGCNDPMRLFNHFLTTLDVKDGKNWEIVKLSDQDRTAYRNQIYKAFLENAVKMSSSAASTFVASNNTMMRDLLKTTPTNSDWCGAYEKGKKTVKIKVLKDKYPEYSGIISNFTSNAGSDKINFLANLLESLKNDKGSSNNPPNNGPNLGPGIFVCPSSIQYDNKPDRFNTVGISNLSMTFTLENGSQIQASTGNLFINIDSDICSNVSVGNCSTHIAAAIKAAYNAVNTYVTNTTPTPTQKQIEDRFALEFGCILYKGFLDINAIPEGGGRTCNVVRPASTFYKNQEFGTTFNSITTSTVPCP